MLRDVLLDIMFGCSHSALLIGSTVIALATILFIKSNARRKRVRSNRCKVAKQCVKYKKTISTVAERITEKKFSPEQVDSITELSLSELVASLKNGRLKAVDVLNAYQSKAIEQNEQYNFITTFLEEAEDAALALDESDKPKGMLHGVPVSLKDFFTVKVLKYQGAIPFMKTNIPQTNLHFDCSNPIFGRTLNPWSKQRTPGGSSGGEAAAIAAGSSIVGMGSDIGGSIRIPAHFCGICGIKPTVGRISKKGLHMFKGENLLAASMGPMGRDVDSVATMMKALLVPYMFELDPMTPPLTFNTEEYESNRPLKIGFYLEDDWSVPIPACNRAVELAVATLKSQGHEVVPYSPTRAQEMYLDYYMRFCMADGGQELLKSLEDEPVFDPTIKGQVSVLKLPKILRTTLAILLKPMMPLLSRMILCLNGFRSIKDMNEKKCDIQEWQLKILQDWERLGLDAVVCPVAPCVAVLNGYPAKCLGALSYTAYYNLADFPAGVVPVTTVTAEDDQNLKSYYNYDVLWMKNMKMGCVDAIGLPVGVQCVTKPWHEELCLRVMRDVENGLKKD
ncbi:fatty-acid amide hydrolase 1 isoform X2 [Lingula anatina]|uniref:fatty acid amide hydrolase n=1 Tax=Lingula anatina TaxID=7574 RepID=A0A1S3KD91_LINAN|nr:fatty-acid amide hydrolase 1 isoform X2 [Lingula anatina]|eukprot:XP_013420226.1 fatty-acid amide hydrolase 1 isoform X2 [Lingula anatina]